MVDIHGWDSLGAEYRSYEIGIAGSPLVRFHAQEG